VTGKKSNVREGARNQTKRNVCEELGYCGIKKRRRKKQTWRGGERFLRGSKRGEERSVVGGNWI